MLKNQKPQFQLIYINGPSSAGKTTLAEALQEAFCDPFLHIGIDKVIEMMPAKINDWEGGNAPEGFSWKQGTDEKGNSIHEIQSGPFAQKMVLTLKEIVRTLAQLDHYVIIDDVALSSSEVDVWRQALQPYKVLWIGLTAPLELLEERERMRDNRIQGSCRAQAAYVHHGVAYDLEFNTSKESLQAIVDRIKTKIYPSLDHD